MIWGCCGLRVLKLLWKLDMVSHMRDAKARIESRVCGENSEDGDVVMEQTFSLTFP
jgi:hypothetical protein